MSELTRLSDILPSAAGRGISQFAALNKAWKTCAGDAIAFMTTLSKFENGILNISVHDQNWLTELNFMKGELSERLRQINPEITGLSFFFRFRKQQNTKTSDSHKQMTEKEKVYADRLVSSIKDEQLRESFRSAMYSYFTVYSLDDYLKC